MFIVVRLLVGGVELNFFVESDNNFNFFFFVPSKCFLSVGAIKLQFSRLTLSQVNTSVLELNLEDNWVTADGMKDIGDMLVENCYISILVRWRYVVTSNIIVNKFILWASIQFQKNLLGLLKLILKLPTSKKFQCTMSLFQLQIFCFPLLFFNEWLKYLLGNLVMFSLLYL